MSIYLDTSALVSLYYPEPCSERVANLVAGSPLPFSQLHELETKNALMLKVFRQEASIQAVRETLAAIDDDLKAGSLFRPDVDWLQTFRTAIELATRHSGRVGCRSLDVLHVAVAAEMKARRFVSMDVRQKALAKKTGLEVLAA